MPILPGMDAETNLSLLLIAVAQGDRPALLAVYERQSARLFGVANAILRDRYAATAWLTGIVLGRRTRTGNVRRLPALCDRPQSRVAVLRSRRRRRPPHGDASRRSKRRSAARDFAIWDENDFRQWA